MGKINSGTIRYHVHQRISKPFAWAGAAYEVYRDPPDDSTPQGD